MTWLLAVAWPWVRGRAWPWVWAHRSVILLGLVVLLAAGLVRQCRATCAAERRAGAGQEGAHAASTGTAIVPTVAADAELERKAADLLRENADLRAGKAALEAEVGRLTLRYVVQGRVSGRVDAPPRPPDPPGAPASTPVLAQGDVLDLELEGVGLQGPRGAQLALATVAARRGSDGALLLRRLLTAPATQASVDEQLGGAPPAKPSRWWRAGPTLGVTEDGLRDGWRAGVAGTGRVRLFGEDREALVHVQAGPKRFMDGQRAASFGASVGVLW